MDAPTAGAIIGGSDGASTKVGAVDPSELPTGSALAKSLVKLRGAIEGLAATRRGFLVSGDLIGVDLADAVETLVPDLPSF